METKKAKVILVGNYKGGVGKTVSTLGLAAVFARKFNVLVVDVDPQSSLSEIALKNVKIELNDNDLYNDSNNYYFKKFINNSYIMYMHSNKLAISNLIKFNQDIFTLYNNDSKRLDILPNSLFYSIKGIKFGLDEISMIIGSDERYLFLLKKLFIDSEFYDKYDYIFIDTPPNNNIITQSCFLLSDYLIIPTIMDAVSVDGVEHYYAKISEIYTKYYGSDNMYSNLYKSYFGKPIKLLGIFETMRSHNANNKPDNIRKRLVNKFNLFDSVIKEIDSVVTSLYELNNIIDSCINIGEGNDTTSNNPKGYNSLYDEIINML